MTRPPRHAVVCAVVVGAALLLALALGPYAESRDVLAAAVSFNAMHLAVVAVLLVLRLFLVLVAPGWVLFVLMRWACPGRKERRAPPVPSRPARSPTEPW